jgi:hypothetical protein
MKVCISPILCPPNQGRASSGRGTGWRTVFCFAWTSGLALAGGGRGESGDHQPQIDPVGPVLACGEGGRTLAQAQMPSQMQPQTLGAGAALGLYKSVKNAYLVRHGSLKANAH